MTAKDNAVSWIESFFFFFKQPHQWHMEVLGLGAESELHL